MPPDPESASAPADLGEPAEASHPLAQDLLLNPSHWNLWPAVAVLRWMLRSSQSKRRGLIYRAKPSLGFPSNEIADVALNAETLDIILTAPGLASPGSALPTADVARIVADAQRPRGGAIAAWLDGPGDRFMQAAELAKSQYSAAFSLATGGTMDATVRVAELAGRTAPLKAEPKHRLADGVEADPDGAVALGGYFLGPPSAMGLAALATAFTGLPAEVQEFAGATVRVIQPARIGGPLMRMLGERCELPTSGVELFLDGGSRENARDWANDRGRRRSLDRLCREYVGTPSITTRTYLTLAPENTEPAALGRAAFGGMAVLGRPSAPVTLPLTGGLETLPGTATESETARA